MGLSNYDAYLQLQINKGIINTALCVLQYDIIIHGILQRDCVQLHGLLRCRGTRFSDATRLHVILLTGAQNYMICTNSEAHLSLCPFCTWSYCLESKVALAQS